MSNLDNILDIKLDDLEDMPEFKIFPAGVHKVVVDFNTREINGALAILVNFTLVETLELVDPSKEGSCTAGDESNTLCMLDNEYGRAALKMVTIPIAETLGLDDPSIKDMIEQGSGTECLIVSSTRKDKKDPDRVYLVIKELQVA